MYVYIFSYCQLYHQNHLTSIQPPQPHSNTPFCHLYHYHHPHSPHHMYISPLHYPKAPLQHLKNPPPPLKNSTKGKRQRRKKEAVAVIALCHHLWEVIAEKGAGILVDTVAKYTTVTSTGGVMKKLTFYRRIIAVKFADQRELNFCYF